MKSLPIGTVVALTIYDLLARRVATFVDPFMESGVHEVPFDASGLSSGVYIYRLATAQDVQTRKMVLVK